MSAIMQAMFDVRRRCGMSFRLREWWRRWWETFRHRRFLRDSLIRELQFSQPVHYRRHVE
jgi:hypothetical protein